MPTRISFPRRCASSLLVPLLLILVSCEPAKKVDSDDSGQALKVVASPTASSTTQLAQKPPASVPDAAPKEAPTPPQKPAPLPEECEEQRKEILAFHDGLPAKFYDASHELAGRMDAMTQASRDYLKGCDPQATVVNKAEVQYTLAKFLFVLSSIRKAQWRDTLKKTLSAPDTNKRVEQMSHTYMLEVQNLADEASKALPKEHPYRWRALSILGQAATGGSDFVRAKAAYVAFLDDYGQNEELLGETASVTVALAAAYRDSAEYDEGIALLEQARLRLAKTSSYPYLMEGLYKLQLHKGDLDGMARASDAVLTMLPETLKNDKLTGRQRGTIESLIVYHGFRKAYVELAKGEVQTAREAFNASVDDINNKEKKMQERGKGLPPAWKIYRDRSIANVNFLETLGEKPAPDLNLGTSWVSEKKLELADVRDKAVVVLFRRVGDPRSAPVVEEIGRFCELNPKMEMVTISYLRSEKTIAQELVEMRDELDGLGYSGAAGFDPDFAKKSLFHSYHAMVGSATLLMVAPGGNLVWFQQDPRAIDDNFIKAILHRLVGETQS